MFVVDIRDSNHEPYPGIEIGDMGHKIGCDGVDNGWMMFSNYRIKRDWLLNRFADVNEDGEYVSEIKSKNKRFGLHLATLSGGRHAILQLSSDSGIMASIAAIWYAATWQ